MVDKSSHCDEMMFQADYVSHMSLYVYVYSNNHFSRSNKINVSEFVMAMNACLGNWARQCEI